MMNNLSGALQGAAGNMGMGMLENVLGGNGQLDANSPIGQMLAPIADGVSQKLHLPPQVGQMVVAFAATKLMQMAQGKMGASQSAGGGQSTQGNMPNMGGMNADQVLGKITSGQGLDASMLKSSGMSKELASKANISEQQATDGLQYAIGAISAGVAGQKSYQGMPLPDMSMLQGMMKQQGTK